MDVAKINATLAFFRVGDALGLTPRELRVLLSLVELGDVPAQQLARYVNVTSGAMTGLADRLHTLGFVDRERGEDRRVVYLSLTKLGLKRLVKAYKEVNRG